jgi:hypothetical protein
MILYVDLINEKETIQDRITENKKEPNFQETPENIQQFINFTRLITLVIFRINYFQAWNYFVQEVGVMVREMGRGQNAEEERVK